jgi:hypothetical protein
MRTLNPNRRRRQGSHAPETSRRRTVARRLALASTGTMLLLASMTATADAAVVRKGYRCEGPVGEEPRCV